MTFTNFSKDIITEVVLTGFSNLQQLQKTPLFFLFLVMYILTLTGNILVILMIQIDHRLHTPMYYFLKNLSWMEIIFTTSVTPKMLALLISNENTMSFIACTIQSYIYFISGCAEVLILAAMSVDRYMAICNPLRYTAIMSTKVCQGMVLSCWLSSFFAITVSMLLRAVVPFCGSNTVDHFFCDSAPLIEMICADTHLIQVLDLTISCSLLLSSVSVTTVSYIWIIVTVMKMPSATGRRKAFGTCSSHITVASIYYVSSIFIYVKPAGSSSMLFNKVATVFTTIVTPMLNPMIYSFRNKTVKDVLRDALARVWTTLRSKP